MSCGHPCLEEDGELCPACAAIDDGYDAAEELLTEPDPDVDET